MSSTIIESIKKSTVLKLFLILIILLLLLIPLEMVKGVINDRYWTNNQVSSELTETWGQAQVINGPFVFVPIQSNVEVVNSKNEKSIITKEEYLHILPNQLSIQSNIQTQELHRSIYKSIVYNSSNQLKGRFNPVDIQKYHSLKEGEKILMDETEITLVIKDLLGVKKLPVIRIADQEYKFSLRK